MKNMYDKEFKHRSDKEKITLKRFQTRLKRKATPAERKFGEYLQKLRIPYKFQWGTFFANSFIIVDFFIPPPFWLVFEMNGDYHNSKDQKMADACRTWFLEKEKGFQVFRFTNKEVLTNGYKTVSKILNIFATARPNKIIHKKSKKLTSVRQEKFYKKHQQLCQNNYWFSLSNGKKAI